MLEKLQNKNVWFSSATTLLAVMISLIIAFILIIIFSDNPAKSIFDLLTGPFSSQRNFGNVISMASTFTFTGIAICIMFQASLFNVAAEGAFFMGAMFAAAAATMWNLPVGLALIVPMLVGAVTGAVICYIPGVLKAKFNADELVSSLMLNYIILYLGLYLLTNYIRDPQFGALASYQLPQDSKIANLIPGTSVNFGVLIAVLLVIISYMFLYRTKTGYSVRVLGQNKDYANYSGIQVAKVIILSQLAGGAIAGLGGAVEVMGMYSRFQWTALPGYGWDGVIVAILAGNKPQLVPIAALFLAYLRIGANVMARSGDIPSELITVIQAIMIILVTASALLSRIKKKVIIKEALADGKTN
ncbi:ABC transporter permease [Clostridium aminobutyricum]|uniref:ABC transporter permease n=1 Tax=Clostridium aminobutyricum TaxID=33953 RepID=A0A939D953_CLOAM|nr:ABC transporter permease [Clostridium aminobutyricum]MBN7773375.1 ABC transporter permease [Clostridium aminobutyricum]